MEHAKVLRVVTAFATALERGDADALVALLTKDVTWSMLPTSANGQPAVGFYLWDEAAGAHLSWCITVLTLRGDHIAELTSFRPRPVPVLRTARCLPGGLTPTGRASLNQRRLVIP
jgi:RNA polymerase sigma-70 factor (ECF subfamily)